MGILVLAGAWGSGSAASPSARGVDLLLALLLTGCVWRLAERHQRELLKLRANRLVSFPVLPSGDPTPTPAQAPRPGGAEVVPFAGAEQTWGPPRRGATSFVGRSRT